MISFSRLVFATLASVLIGHTDHPECVIDDSLQKNGWNSSKGTAKTSMEYIRDYKK